MTLLALVYAGFVFYVLSGAKLADTVFCAAGQRVFHIPESACRQYVSHFAQNHSQEELDFALNVAIFSAFDHAEPEENRRKSLRLVPPLLAAGANVNTISPTHGATLLNEAIISDNATLVHYLLQIGANPDMPDRTDRRQTAWEFLYWLEAEWKLDRQEVRRALEEGSRSDAEQNTSHNWSSSAAAAR